MKRKLAVFFVVLCFTFSIIQTFAQDTTYTVRYGDTMWKIAAKYQVGISEIIAKNPQVKNPALIYPGQKLTIPNINDVKAWENEVVRLTNIERSKRGLQTLTTNWQLSRVARYKSQDMINKNYFDHQSPTYGSPFNMMESFGLRFSAAAENIAMGQQSPQEVMNAWMNSPGHRSNILSPAYTQIGVGLAKDKYGRCYWTQHFMKPAM
ncbi:MAG: SafA/ExsA family spore coat assembly protein [Caulobacteraceae bacterium]